jgi:broad specificity phosphatase PhoE
MTTKESSLPSSIPPEPSPPRRLVRVAFFRHGQGQHNAESLQIFDPSLTSRGEDEARAIAKLYATAGGKLPAPQLVVVSPLHRTLQTATLAFGDLGSPFLATDLCREILNQNRCNYRHPVQIQRQKFPQVDFTFVEQREKAHGKIQEECEFRFRLKDQVQILEKRAQEFLEFLETTIRDRNLTEVAVVSHASFSQALLKVLLGVNKHHGPHGMETGSKLEFWLMEEDGDPKPYWCLAPDTEVRVSMIPFLPPGAR